MGPDAKKPMTIAAVAVLLVVIVFLKGFTPLVRFQVITVFIPRLRNAILSNGSTTIPPSFRLNRFVVAIFGAPISTSTADVEQARAAPPPAHFDPFSIPLLTMPLPAYTHHHNDELYSGAIVHIPYSANAIAWRSGDALPAFQVSPPPYASSSSLRIAPGTSITTS